MPAQFIDLLEPPISLSGLPQSPSQSCGLLPHSRRELIVSIVLSFGATYTICQRCARQWYGRGTLSLINLVPMLPPPPCPAPAFPRISSLLVCFGMTSSLLIHALT